MAKICSAICLIVIVAIWKNISGQTCLNQPCHCCKVAYSSCRSGDKFCLDGCNRGIWGNRCFNHCPSNCATCTQGSTADGYPCTSCKAGTYGSHDCASNCPDNCATCAFDSNNGYPCTTCTDKAKYGLYCNTSCSAGCDGGTCYNYGSCSCIAGYSGTKCDAIDCPDTCKTCTSPSNCITCVDDYYNGYKYGTRGENTTICEHPCSTQPHCKTCIGYKSCYQCDDGYYGQDCQNNCSSGCQTATCNKESGKCNCQSGFSGNKCDHCIAGKYGDSCNNDCLSQNCNNTICARDSGRCLSCNTGYYGNNLCDQSCSTACNYSACNFTFGTCTNDCISGYSGDKCCLNNNNCETCSSNTHCSVCKTGYSGDKCCLNNSNCETCSSETQCSVYKNGYSGDKCCVNNEGCLTCSSLSECSICKAGYDINTNCSTCVLNYYGSNCESHCGYCLINGEQSKCYGHNGTCIVGCQEGFYGDKCDLRCHQKSISKEYVAAIVGGSIGGGVVIAVICILLIKRRNNRPQCCSVSMNDVTQGREDTNHVYVNTMDRANDRVEVTNHADDYENHELGEIVHIDSVVTEDVEESTTHVYEVPIQHNYENVGDVYEPLNQQRNEQGNYDELIVPSYQNIKISN